MAKRLLHQVDRRTPVEAMARVRMAQPVGRDLGREPGPQRRTDAVSPLGLINVTAFGLGREAFALGGRAGGPVEASDRRDRSPHTMR